MGKQKQVTTANGKANHKKPAARSRPIAERGIYDAEAFAKVMSALMTDLLTGAVEPQVANAVCNSGGKLLKIVEMKHKRAGRSLELAAPK